jgi:predicted HD phosphohydrolase
MKKEKKIEDYLNQTDNSIFSKIFWKTLLIKQNKYHRYGVLGHSLKVVFSPFKDKKYRFIPAGFLHDIGKPFVAYQKENDIIQDEYSFTDHEEKSYQIIKNWFFLSDWTKNIVRYHYLIMDIEKSTRKKNFTRLERLQKSWDSLDDDFISDLEIFFKYDNLGKK